MFIIRTSLSRHGLPSRITCVHFTLVVLLYRDFPRDFPKYCMSHDNCQSGGTYLFPVMHNGACAVAFINHYTDTMVQQNF